MTDDVVPASDLTGADGADDFLDGEAIEVPALRIHAVDTTAAGDCFVGVLVGSRSRSFARRGDATSRNGRCNCLLPSGKPVEHSSQ
ncbi:sugar/nucleoside kinase (ribokinase family) [Phyllobacterium sp. 1468]|uniref:PfkB family carbohydrate kinase n=1 Tax=Phyllobacterium sp. 1468 TaxID=2817759 RepID=UPI00285E1EB8|nr:PfkB family carbohydrate kinase [Phyllobacterium sp. 1468]MDR6635770.1 sugar/nucleoside kinase (ribokinase family) [Phyllobacterium sp. 1468]